MDLEKRMYMTTYRQILSSFYRVSSGGAVLKSQNNFILKRKIFEVLKKKSFSMFINFHKIHTNTHIYLYINKHNVHSTTTQQQECLAEKSKHFTTTLKIPCIHSTIAHLATKKRNKNFKTTLQKHTKKVKKILKSLRKYAPFHTF